MRRLANQHIVLLMLTGIFATGCFGSKQGDLESIDSPNKKLELRLSINKSKADLTKFNCLKFEVLDAGDNVLCCVQTSASDTQKWAIGWFDDSTIILDSSDIGTRAWRLNDGTITDDQVTNDQYLFGKRLMEIKY